MPDPNTPLEKIAEMCNSMEELRKLLKEYSDDKTNADDIPISPELLQEAIYINLFTRIRLQLYAEKHPIEIRMSRNSKPSK